MGMLVEKKSIKLFIALLVFVFIFGYSGLNVRAEEDSEGDNNLEDGNSLLIETVEETEYEEGYYEEEYEVGLDEEIVDIETYQNYDSKGIDERICDEAAEDNEIVAGSAAFQPVYNDVDYSPVFDIEYYKANNPDVAKAFGDDSDAILAHFVNNGMREGRQASANFNVYSYAYKYPDLRIAFGNNLPNYYYHYINKGKMKIEPPLVLQVFKAE